MEVCMGMIGMQPSEFWNSSVIEIHSAIDGFTEFNTSSKEKEEPMTSSRLDEIMELYPD